AFTAGEEDFRAEQNALDEIGIGGKGTVQRGQSPIHVILRAVSDGELEERSSIARVGFRDFFQLRNGFRGAAADQVEPGTNQERVPIFGILLQNASNITR